MTAAIKTPSPERKLVKEEKPPGDPASLQVAFEACVTPATLAATTGTQVATPASAGTNATPPGAPTKPGRSKKRKAE